MDSKVKTPPPLVLHTRVIAGKGGGPEKTILNSPRFLDGLGYRGVCVYLRDPGDDGFEVIRERAHQKKAPLLAVDDFGIKDFGVVARMRKAVEKVLSGDCPPLTAIDPPEGTAIGGADAPFLWHGHDYKSNLLGLLLKRHFPGMRLVTTVHGWVHKTLKTPIYYAIDKWCLKRYDQVICVSRDLFDDCRKLGVPDSRLSLIDNAIALDDYEFRCTPEEARRELGLNEQSPLIAGVGRLSDEKGFDLLISAVGDLIDEGRDIGLAIAGEGAERSKLQQQIDKRGLKDRIQLLGFLNDPRAIYRAAEVYVLSSYREGLPNVVLEAMAMGSAVVSTQIAGMPDLVVHDQNGLMVPTGDSEAIRDAIRDLLDDEPLRNRLVAAGRETIESRFSFQRRMEKIASIYAKVIS